MPQPDLVVVRRDCLCRRRRLAETEPSIPSNALPALLARVMCHSLRRSHECFITLGTLSNVQHTAIHADELEGEVPGQYLVRTANHPSIGVSYSLALGTCRDRSTTPRPSSQNNKIAGKLFDYNWNPVFGKPINSTKRSNSGKEFPMNSVELMDYTDFHSE